MKKYIYSVLTAVLVILMTACENDPITISYGVPVKVDPSGVIAPFTYEVKTGELESFSSSYKLRVRLLAYDSEGKLAAADSSFLSNYASIMNSSLTLPEGVYVLVAITDVVRRESNRTALEYWYLSNHSDINQVRVTNAGYIGAKNKVLGIMSQRISVTGGETGTINMAPRPAGALLLVEFLNIKNFNDVTKYELQTNRNSDFMTLDSQGSPVTVPENVNNQFNWRIQYVEPPKETSSNIYGWNFMFPVNNANFRFVYNTETETNQVLVTNMIVNLNAGDEYVFILDLCDEDNDDQITYDFGKVNGNASRAVNLPITPWMQKKIADSQRTAKLKDLIK